MISQATEIRAPERQAVKGKSIFLAGSIEMATAEDWQTSVVTQLQHLPITILNPRRPDWSNDWRQSASDPRFREQVEWELDMLERCDVIVMYYDPSTKAPISLLELGLFASSEKLVVCCSRGFYRRASVEIVCERAKIPLFDALEGLVGEVTQRLKE